LTDAATDAPQRRHFAARPLIFREAVSGLASGTAEKHDHHNVYQNLEVDLLQLRALHHTSLRWVSSPIWKKVDWLIDWLFNDASTQIGHWRLFSVLAQPWLYKRTCQVKQLAQVTKDSKRYTRRSYKTQFLTTRVNTRQTAKYNR